MALSRKKKLETRLTELQATAFQCMVAKNNAENQLTQTIQAIQKCQQELAALPRKEVTDGNSD